MNKKQNEQLNSDSLIENRIEKDENKKRKRDETKKEKKKLKLKI